MRMKALIISFALLAGCVSGPSEWAPGFSSRTPPEIRVGQEMVLQVQSAKAVTSLIGSDGYVQVFALNEHGDIRHFEVSADKVVSQQLIGVATGMVDSKGDPSTQLSIDAIEHPKGTLRVVVNGVQYVRQNPGASWQQAQNSRCVRFLAFREKLYCAFIAKGNEIGSAKRTDRTFGLLIILPLYWSEEKRSDKLVLAEEKNGEWVVRAVVDPNEPFDIDPDFFASVDASGAIQFFYFGSRGGGFWGIVGGAGGAGAFSFATPSAMRFAQVSANALVGKPTTESEKTASSQARQDLLMIDGVPLEKMPFVKSRDVPKIQNPSAWNELRPLTQQFSFDVLTGQIRGLMNPYYITFNDIHHIRSGYVGISMSSGVWINHVDIAVGDMPKQILWMSHPGPFVRVDQLGKLHALVIGKEESWRLQPPCKIGYFAEKSNGWSAPIILGNCQRWSQWSSASWIAPYSERSLAFTSQGNIFATWVSENGSLVGRWFSPVSEND